MITSQPVKHPRVLVVDATPFSQRNNNGITKSNLFFGWPKEKLLQIHCSNIQPGFDVCEHHWNLTKWDIIKGIIGIEQNAELLTTQSIQVTDCNSLHEIKYDSRPAIERRLSVLPLSFRILLGEMIFRLPSVLSKSLRRWIDDFQPEVIFSLLGNGPILRTVMKVSQWRNIPVFPYFTDDWVSTLYKDHAFGYWLRRSMFYWFNECLKRSPIRLAISDAMTEEYTQRYGGQFKTFMNLVDRHDYIFCDKNTDSNKSVRLLFTGSLKPGRWESLHAIGEALHDLHNESIFGELLIYTFPDDIKKHRDSLNLEPVMRVMGTASSDEVRHLQQEVDILVHVESFDAEIRKYTKYSLSTKIPQYMMAGACIFGYGPAEVASMKYLSDWGAGTVVGEENRELLRAVLRELIINKERRASTAKQARAVALEHNEVSKKREEFRQLIVQSCNAWKKSKL